MKDAGILTLCGLISVAALVTAFFCGAMWSRTECETKRLKDSLSVSMAETSATADAAKHSNTLEKGLIADATRTESAGEAAKRVINARPGPVYAPKPDCGPSAYVITVQAAPDDAWRDFADGYNSVLFPTGEVGSGTSVHSADSASIMLATAAKPE